VKQSSGHGDMKSYSLRLVKQSPQEGFTNIRKEEDSFIAVCLEQWTKFQSNKRVL